MKINNEALLAAIEEAPESASLRELLRALDLGGGVRTLLRKRLKELEAQGRVERVGGSNWRLPRAKPAKGALTGTLSINRRGMGFVRLDEESAARFRGDGDVMVTQLDLADALDGDKVEVGRIDITHRGAQGEILGVIERAQHDFVGYFQRIDKNRGEVTPRSAFLHRTISVPLPDDKFDVKNLEWVVARITEYTPAPQPLKGEIVERLGASHDKGIDVLLVLRDRGIVAEFPADVEKAAEELRVDWDAEAKRRRDLRALPTATIDPATAKDFDDALSIEARAEGGWRLWVHIADVSHFVTPDSPLDREAHERSTSVYPVDRVVPMLPERISNDLCSLRPREDRLAMTAEMDFSEKGELERSDFYSSIINSNQRLVYEEAQAFILGTAEGREVVAEELHEPLTMLRDCARALRRARFARGALDLDLPEMTVEFSHRGDVSGISFRERFEAHMLVEDCMLAANEAVARFLTKRQIPFLYRIHESADPDRLELLVPVLKAMGISLRTGKEGDITPQDLQHALNQLSNRKHGHILRRLVLRALKQAKYSEKNAGHFGLASKCYCHFTSPIRRYPDVVVHRQLRAIERNEPLPYPKSDDGFAELHELGRHTSYMEREAEDAERETQSMKAVEYIEQYVGDEFDGVITGVQGYGMFIELLPHGIEGLVSVRSLDDRFELDDLGIALVGRRTGRRFRITDEVRVRLVRADPFAGQVDLELVNEGGGARRTDAAAKGAAPPQAFKGKKKGEKPFYRDAARKGGGKQGKRGSGGKGRRKG